MDKDPLREDVWQRLQDEGAAAFPFPPHGRIPNFKGAADAARALADAEVFQHARNIKCNPDAPQRYVRIAALESGKTVFMAVPRLREWKCFWKIDPRRVDDVRKAASIKGAAYAAEPVAPEDMPAIDLVVAGCVAVDRHGGRVGKGGGYSDLEWGLAREAQIVDGDTPTATTVHPLQVVDDVPMRDHDVPMDTIFTPDGALDLEPRHDKPAGIQWDLLSDDDVAQMPVLEQMRS